MFTLKLFRRALGEVAMGNEITTKIVEVHHIDTVEIEDHMIQISAFDALRDPLYQTYFVGEPKSRAESTAIDFHGTEDCSHWGWAVLENAAGNTTQHFRPASYG